MADKSTRPYCVVGAGRAFTDVIGNLSFEELAAFGIPVDYGQEFDGPEHARIKAAIKNPLLLAGGATANTVATVAALGGKSGYFCKVGRDDVGEVFLDDFKRRGVDLCCDPYDPVINRSGCCLVLLTPDGHRSFATNMGSCDEYVPQDFAAFDYASADFFLFDVRFLTESKAAPLFVEELKRARGKTKIVSSLHNLQPPDKAMAKFVAEVSDLIIGNDVELEIFVKGAPYPLRDDQILIVTKGEKGAELFQGQTHLAVPATEAKPFVNSVGAGDGFIAGYLAAQSMGMSQEESLHCATRAASAILEEKGARPTRPLAHLMKAA